MNNFVFLRFFRISYIMVKKFNFQFSIEFFSILKKVYILKNTVSIQICRSCCSKQFCIITFFRIPYNLTEKWNLDIGFFL